VRTGRQLVRPACRIEYSRCTWLPHWSDRGIAMSNDIDLHPDITASSGHATAATSGDWASWAQQAKTAFSNAAADVKDATVSDAVESYGSNLNGTLTSVAHDVDALGRNTVSATNAMTNSDADSTSTLNRQGSANDSFHSLLSRPI
jgi:hypothetical protein